MRRILLYLILALAIGLAGTVAYVSVNGLMKVFTGAGTIGLTFFIIIELAKVISTSAIHTYGKTIKWYYKLALTLCIIGSMMITSIGIYGFLSHSYKDSYAKMETNKSKITLLENKKDNFTNQLEILNNEKTTLNNTIIELSKGLANNVIQYKDKETGKIITTTSSSNRKALEKELNNSRNRLSIINSRIDTLNNKIFNLQSEILEAKMNDNASKELGTLQYLSDITNKPMDEVMGWLMVILILLGDPMAVLMVIIFNKVVNDNHKSNTPKESDNIVNDTPLKKNNRNSINFSDDVVVHNNNENVDKEKPIKKTINLNNGDILEKSQSNHINNDIKNGVENFKNLKKKIKTSPVIKTGKVTRSDIKEIKEMEGRRGYSVNVPDPNDNGINKIGTNKEYRVEKPGKLFFNRKNK